MSGFIQPVSLLSRAAGLGVMLGAGYFAREQFKVFHRVKDMGHTSELETYNYNRMMNSHGYVTDMGPMNGWASHWRHFWKMGPYNLFYKVRNICDGVGDFIKNYVFTPNLSWLAIGGAYMAGIQMHKIVTGPAKFLWKTGVLQKAGNGIVNFFGNARNFKWLSKATGFLLGTPQGLMVTATGLMLGYLFSKHVDRSYQRELVQPYALFP